MKQKVIELRRTRVSLPVMMQMMIISKNLVIVILIHCSKLRRLKFIQLIIVDHL